MASTEGTLFNNECIWRVPENRTMCAVCGRENLSDNVRNASENRKNLSDDVRSASENRTRHGSKHRPQIRTTPSHKLDFSQT